MKYRIVRGEKRPAYLQLYRQIRNDIVNEVYTAGQRLPSKRLVADELGISTVTVEHAYSLLCDEGYATARERSGYFVIFRKSDGMFKPDEHPTRPIQTPSAGTQYDFSFPALSRAMRRVINECGEAILEKAPAFGCLELRDAICRYLDRSRGITAEPYQIVIGSGSEYLYGLIALFFGREYTFATEYPSYKKIKQVYDSFSVKTVSLPLGNDGIKSSAIWNTDADILHITPYRSFPSGITAPASKRHEYIKWSTVKPRYIIEDDFESEFSVSSKYEETLFATSDSDNIIYMNTFSQTISPALRAGYMVLPKSLVNSFSEKLGFYSCTVPTFEQLLLAYLINSGDFERHINRIRRRKRNENEKIKA